MSMDDRWKTNIQNASDFHSHLPLIGNNKCNKGVDSHEKSFSVLSLPLASETTYPEKYSITCTVGYFNE